MHWADRPESWVASLASPSTPDIPLGGPRTMTEPDPGTTSDPRLAQDADGALTDEGLRLAQDEPLADQGFAVDFGTRVTRRCIRRGRRARRLPLRRSRRDTQSAPR
jgi:hypothetical protein